MTFLQRHKEIIPIIAITITVCIAAYDLFSKQQDYSELLNSGTRINPVSLSGRAACEIPIPDISKQETGTKFRNKAKELTD